MHTHHAVQEVVLAPGTGLLTQVPAIVSLLWRMDRQFQGFKVSRYVSMCVYMCIYVIVCVCECVYMCVCV